MHIGPEEHLAAAGGNPCSSAMKLPIGASPLLTPLPPQSAEVFETCYLEFTVR